MYEFLTKTQITIILTLQRKIVVYLLTKYKELADKRRDVYDVLWKTCPKTAGWHIGYKNEAVVFKRPQN